MSSHDIKYQINTATEKNILDHLNSCNAQFLEALKEKVDLKEYAKKLSDKAIKFESWQNNSLIGLIAAYFNDPKNSAGYISNVSVIENSFNKGFGTKLLEKTIKYGKDKKFSTIELEVTKTNDKAIKLYKKFGFNISGENDKDYKMKLKL